MKAELSIPPELISKIADEVVVRLTSIISSLQTKPLDVEARLGVVKLGKYLGGVDSPSRADVQEGRHRCLPRSGYIRLKELLAILPVSKSTWYKGIADGRYPKPTKRFGPRIAAWDVRDIRPLLERGIG